MPKWKLKIGETKIETAHFKKWEYLNANNDRKINSIKIIKYIKPIEINGYLNITIYSENTDLREELEKNCTETEGIYEVEKYVLFEHVSDKNNINKIFLTLANYEDISEILDEIFIIVGITKFQFPSEEPLELAKKQQFDQALIKAKKYQFEGYQDAVWMLAEYLNNNKHFQEAFEAYKAIPDNNPYSSQAAEIIVHLIYSTLDAVSKGQLTLSAEEIITYREEQLRYALKAGPDLQNITDQIYHALCDGEGLTPKVTNVKGDADTLIATAREMRELRAQVKQLTAASPATTQPAASTNFFTKQTEEKFTDQQPSTERPRSMSAPPIIKR